MKQRRAVISVLYGVLLCAAVLIAGPPSVSQAQTADRLSVPQKAPDTQNQGRAESDDKAGSMDADLALELMNKYYDRCTQTVFPNLTRPVRNDYCSCTAAKMTEELTKDEISMMAYGQGQPVDETKLLLKVEAPCLYIPLALDEYEYCYFSRRYKSLLSDILVRKEVCECVRDDVEHFMKNNGADFMAYYVEKNGMPDGRLGAIQQNLDYRNYIDDTRTYCINSVRMKQQD